MTWSSICSLLLVLSWEAKKHWSRWRQCYQHWPSHRSPILFLSRLYWTPWWNAGMCPVLNSSSIDHQGRICRCTERWWQVRIRCSWWIHSLFLSSKAIWQIIWPRRPSICINTSEHRMTWSPFFSSMLVLSWEAKKHWSRWRQCYQHWPSHRSPILFLSHLYWTPWWNAGMCPVAQLVFDRSPRKVLPMYGAMMKGTKEINDGSLRCSLLGYTFNEMAMKAVRIFDEIEDKNL